MRGGFEARSGDEHPGRARKTARQGAFGVRQGRAPRRSHRYRRRSSAHRVVASLEGRPRRRAPTDMVAEEEG
eukprot:scaffold95066_cov63-Phaeocystis_antarctica.AAC.3